MKQSSLVGSLVVPLFAWCANGQKAIQDGHCEPYDGEICLGKGLATGDMIYVWPGYGSQSIMHSVLGGLFGVWDILLEGGCRDASKQTLCEYHYPPCKTVTDEATGEVIGVPQLLCNSRCLYKLESCPKREDDAATPGEWNCETDMFAAEGGYVEASGMKWIEEYDGLQLYPEKYFSFTVNGRPHAVECYGGNGTAVKSEESDQCPHPYVKNPDPSSGEDHGTSDTACIMQCPTPIFTDSELRQQWHAFITPGLIAFIPSVLMASGSTADKKKGSTLSHIQVLGIIVLLLIIVGTLPSATLFTDLVCVTNSEYDKGSSALCWISRAEPFVQQILFGLVTFQVYALYAVVVRSDMHGVDAVFKKFRVIRWTLQVMPVLLWAIWIYYYSTQKEDIVNSHPKYATAIQQVNQIRETFRCSPLFPSVELEFALLYVPGIIYSALCLFFVTSILHTSLALAQKATTASAKSAEGRVGLLKMLLFRILDSSKLSLVLLAVGCSVVFIFQIISASYLFPQFEEFGSEAQEWASCNLRIPFCGSMNTEVSTSEGAETSKMATILQDCAKWAKKYGVGNGCGAQPQNKPSHTIMVLASLASSLFPLFVSLAFSQKTLRAAGKKMLTMKPSTFRASSKVGGASSAVSSVQPSSVGGSGKTNSAMSSSSSAAISSVQYE